MRNLKLIITLASSGVLAVLIVIWMSLSIGTKNTEVELKTQVYAQQKKCSTYFDKMWKILKEKAGVTDQYKDAFKDIYPKLIAGRYSGNGDGSMMKWVTESNPTFDASMYKDLMQSIEIERTGFKNEQDRLVDLKREHDVLLQKIPQKWFLSDTIKPINIVLVTSSKTDDAYKTGKEDDVELFDKKK